MSRKIILCCIAEIIAIIAVACVAEATSTTSSGATAAAPAPSIVVAEVTTGADDHAHIAGQAQQPVPGCDPAKTHIAPNIFWWPAHRPMEVFLANGQQVPWSSIPFTNEGDLMMVSAWKTLGFIKYNPDYPKNPILNPEYILVE